VGRGREKGAGLSLPDALAFWQKMFARKIPGDKFHKTYAYSIRHNYGKEGKRTDYTPYSCAKIINENPGPGEYHGCPFRQYSESKMRQKLTEKKVRPAGIEEIVKLMNGQHYQLACQRYFSLTHNDVSPEGVGNHPNKYFEESVKYHNAVAAGNNLPSNASTPTASVSRTYAAMALDGNDGGFEAAPGIESSFPRKSIKFYDEEFDDSDLQAIDLSGSDRKHTDDGNTPIPLPASCSSSSSSSSAAAASGTSVCLPLPTPMAVDASEPSFVDAVL